MSDHRNYIRLQDFPVLTPSEAETQDTTATTTDVPLTLADTERTRRINNTERDARARQSRRCVDPALTTVKGVFYTFGLLAFVAGVGGGVYLLANSIWPDDMKTKKSTGSWKRSVDLETFVEASISDGSATVINLSADDLSADDFKLLSELDCTNFDQVDSLDEAARNRLCEKLEKARAAQSVFVSATEAADGSSSVE